jgi:hypothetical protein
MALISILVAGGIAVWLIARRGKTRTKRWIRAAVTALVVVLIPTWDEILGRAYFRHLCATNGGIQVYQRVSLGPEYRDTKLPDIPSLYKQAFISKSYPYSLRSIEDVPGPARIYYVRESILDGQTGTTLGAATNYFYRGGWFGNALSPQVKGGGSCGLDEYYFKRLLEGVFAIPR